MGKNSGDVVYGSGGGASGGTWFAVDVGGGGGGGGGQGLSYIDDHEVAEAKKLIDDEFTKTTGKPFGMRVAGYYIACKIYVRPEEIKKIKTEDGKEVTLYLPDQVRDSDKYQSCAALVCGIGPQAFTGYDLHGHSRFPRGPACRVGDWIALPRSVSFMLSYRGVAMALIPDDMILGIIEDPTDVKPINQAALI